MLKCEWRQPGHSGPLSRSGGGGGVELCGEIPVSNDGVTIARELAEDLAAQVITCVCVCVCARARANAGV
jgi:hypothetical protein